MKVNLIQPFYSSKEQDTQKCFEQLLQLLDQCSSDMDLIVLPEYSDIPAVQDTESSFYKNTKANHEVLLNKACETAKRCNAIVFVNALYMSEKGGRNTTFAINGKGEIVGKYFKAHPAPSEIKLHLDDTYSQTPSLPYTLTIDGIKFAFLTCYDFYFYENYAQIARLKPDVVIGNSLQRTDTHQALETMCRFVAYNTAAYLVRSSVSLGDDSTVCGTSCIVSPDSTVIVNMHSKIGMECAEIDPKKKYLKAAGFGGSLATHPEYTEVGRRPWLYRNAGPSLLPYNSMIPFPRVCAHRGFSAVAPENSLPALGAAVALGASEIEFDLWPTSDGVLVSSHDMTLSRTSDGSGKIYEKTLEELKQLDFGSKFNEEFAGLRIVTFEEILQKFTGKTIMNIHMKNLDDYAPMPDSYLDDTVELIKKYECERYCYLMITNNYMLEYMQKKYPEIEVCAGAQSKDLGAYSMVDRAVKYGCKRVQFFKPYYDEAAFKYAHDHGIIVNVFWSDDLEEAKQLLSWGADCILSNKYQRLAELDGGVRLI
jgi:glycerophosphoryl diester phosphodiesterase/predicted amidohydrolase